MKIVSWNINGIRAAYYKGAKKYFNESNADLLCLQEIKAKPEQIPKDLLLEFQYVYIYSAQKKGYSGVALLCHQKPIKLMMGIGDKNFDQEGRVIIAEFKTCIIYNCYFPHGQRNHSRVPFKLSFYKLLLKKIQLQRKKTRRPIILCGDFNTAFDEIDLANPSANKNSTGFLSIERESLGEYFKAGFIDCYRHLHPHKTGAYTWWTYKNNCRNRNIGWRLDYFLATKNFSKRKFQCIHRSNILGSDHCPVELIF